MKKLLMIVLMIVALPVFISLPLKAQPLSPTIVCLNFDGDPDFPSLTVGRDTSGLSPFTGSAFRLTQDERDEVVQGIIGRLREDYKDFNIRFVTDPNIFCDYTWGIDDTAYVFSIFDSDYERFKTIRLYGKAGGNPNTEPGDYPRHARTWAGSFALLPGVILPNVGYMDIIQAMERNYSDLPTLQLPPIEIAEPPGIIPFDPFEIPLNWLIFFPLSIPISIPIDWQASELPLIPLQHCYPDESTVVSPGWSCGRLWEKGQVFMTMDYIARALANSAAHEFSHLFGALHHGEINPATGQAVNAFTDICTSDFCIGYLLVSQQEKIEAMNNKTFGPDNYQILMDFLGPALPDSPELTSSTHAIGQPSCEQTLTVEWQTPWASKGVDGYSYTIVDQDDPYYNTNRFPDDTIDLDGSTTSFTTTLQPGSWEFNIYTIDSDGTPSKFYSSFWVDIESCSVNVRVLPQTGADFEVGEWGNIYWDPVTYGGDDVGGCYDVSIDLLKGPNIVMNIGSNIPNTLWYGFSAPDTESGTDYNIRLILELQSYCDGYGLPESFVGFSEDFYIASSPIGDLDGDGDVDRNDINVISSHRGEDASACPECDLDGDGVITGLDARKAVLNCTNPRCAP